MTSWHYWVFWCCIVASHSSFFLCIPLPNFQFFFSLTQNRGDTPIPSRVSIFYFSRYPNTFSTEMARRYERAIISLATCSYYECVMSLDGVVNVR